MFQLLGEMPPDPSLPDISTAFKIGNLEVKWYAIFIMIGFIVAIVLSCLKMWKRYKISTEPFYWFILIGVPLAIFGANFGSCVLDSFWNGVGTSPGKPWSQFWSSFGSGLAIEWGIIFVVIAAAIYFPLILKLPRYRVKDVFGETHEVKKVSFWMYADAIMPCILIAQFIGRWGNYFNGEVFGRDVTSESFAWWLSKFLPNMYQTGWKQPLFLWEGIGNAIMFFALFFGVEFIKQRKAGDLGAAYFVWYGLFRICLEPLRDPAYYSPVTMVVSGLFLGFGVIFILCNHLLLDKVRDKKIWHTLFSRGPGEVFRMIGAGWKPELNVRYQDSKFADCVRKPVEMIYFGAW